MATGIASPNSIIDTQVALGTWIKLHVGDPGAAGTANAATNTTRQQATFAAASGGSATTTTDITWTGAPATETYTYWSMWSASTAGTFVWSGTLLAGETTIGGSFKLTAGHLTISLTGAA